jgi:agmatinase
MDKGWDPNWEFNPFNSWARVLDCGDVMPAFSDNAVAIEQMERGYTRILERPLYNPEWNPSWLKGHPRIVTLGGDHTILLPILRSLYKKHGRITVVHFDSHIDTWDPEALGGEESRQEGINHGTILFHAAKEGLLAKTGNLHVGIRNKLTGKRDLDTDASLGFSIITANSITKLGSQGIIQAIKQKVPKDALVYLSLDIDVIDPAFAPATGTPETGGWTTRELKEILQGLRGLRIVGSDVVEVSPPYDTQAELTSLAGAEVVFDMLSLMIFNGLEESPKEEL